MIDEELVREIAEAAALASIRELGEPDAARVTASLGRTFVGSGADGRWWWERSIGRTVVLPYGDRDGLSFLDALLEGEASVVMIPTDDEPPPWPAFAGSPGGMVGLLRELPPFEYTMTNDARNWIVFDTHHDTLIVGGRLCGRAEALR